MIQSTSSRDVKLSASVQKQTRYRSERERERENLLAGLAAPVQSTFARLHYNPLHRWVAAVHACFSSTQSPSSACPLPRQKTKPPRSRGSVCGLSSGDV